MTAAKRRRAKPSLPIATALRDSFKKYDAKTLRSDLIAGLIVSLVALPLSMALSIAVGLPPRHGLYTAIVAGMAAALLGGSRTQVTGPTAAFVVILEPIVRQYGVHGLVWCEIMAGIALIGMGFAKLGKLVHYVPYPVTMGFTSGIAVVIATLAMNDFLGIDLPHLEGDFIEKVSALATHLPLLKWQELAVGTATLLAITLFGHVPVKIPAPVVGIALGSVMAWFFNKHGLPVDTLFSRFSYETATGIGHGIEPFPPMLHLPTLAPGEILSLPSYAEFKQLLGPAMVITALAALESLLSATVADSMSGTKHNPNAELTGLGAANILSGLATGIPATGAIARTATNINAGGKTPVAAIVHALLILLYVVTLSGVISHIPMAALAALLVNTAWRMSHAHQFVRTLRLAPRSDIAVLLVCFIMTVFVDMVAGVTAGMILATLLFMRHASDATRARITAPDAGVDRRTRSVRLPPNAMIYHIEGPVFFGSVEHALEQVDVVNKDVKHLIIDLTHVPFIDMTGLVSLKEFLNTLSHDGREIYLCGSRKLTDRILKKIEGGPSAPHVHAITDLDEALKGKKA